jgi:colanic acid/amylovoran biosynthesis glycosyltransferase
LAYVLFRYPQLSQTFVRDEIAGLRRLGFDVDVVSLEPGDRAGVPAGWAGPHRDLPRPAVARALRDHAWWLVRAPRRYRGYLRAALGARRHRRMALLRLPTEARGMAARGRPSRVHTHFAWTTARVVAALAELLGAPASITMHAKDLYTETGPRLRERLRPFDRLITVCNYNVGFLLGRGAIDPDDTRVAVVPCGVEPPAKSAAEPTVDVVSVGRLVEKKGFDVLLDSLATLPGVELTVVGDGPERERLEQRARRLGIADRVTFAGAVPHAETLERIAAARVFCLAARPAADGDIDALPVVLREAMARAVPVVATRLTGIPETVDDEVGWLAAPGSAPELAGALRAALQDEDERRRRGAAARARVLTRWTSERQAQTLAELFTRAPG